MARPAAQVPDESEEAEGGGLLESIGAQLAALTAQVSEIDQRTASLKSETPSRPVEVQLSAETVGQIADALAALQAAGTQALSEAFKAGSDDLTEALSALVQAEVARSLSDAGYVVEVIDKSEAATGDEQDERDELEAAAATRRPVSLVDPVSGDRTDNETDEVANEANEETDLDFERAPLGLDELDDPFIDALVSKTPLTAETSR